MLRQINILTLEFYGGNIIAEPLIGIISVWSLQLHVQHEGLVI